MTSAPVVPRAAASTSSCGTSRNRGASPRSRVSSRSIIAELRDAPSSAICFISCHGTSPTSSTVRTAPKPAMAIPGTMRSSPAMAA